MLLRPRPDDDDCDWLDCAAFELIRDVDEDDVLLSYLPDDCRDELGVDDVFVAPADDIPFNKLYC